VPEKPLAKKKKVPREIKKGVTLNLWGKLGKTSKSKKGGGGGWGETKKLTQIHLEGEGGSNPGKGGGKGEGGGDCLAFALGKCYPNGTEKGVKGKRAASALEGRKGGPTGKRNDGKKAVKAAKNQGYKGGQLSYPTEKKEKRGNL